MLSNAQQVKQFTEGSQCQCPDTPIPMNKQEVKFVIHMVVSEMVELAQTVCDTDTEAIQMVQVGATTDVSKYTRTTDQDEITADQADAAVDAMYYLYNCFAKKGVNLSKVFDVVHKANMAKRDPTTGKFIKRESDGKVLKPAGWLAPNIKNEILNQKTTGSWNI